MLVLGGALLLSSCSQQDEETTRPDMLGPRLEAARTTLDDAETIDLSLTTEKLPSGVTGLLSATGKGNHSPAFTGDVRVSAGGTGVEAQVISTGGEVYAKIAFAPGFNAIDPADFGAPDPAALVARTGGVSELLTKTTDLAAGDRSRDGDDVLTAVDGQLAGTDVKSLIPTADANGTFDVSYRLTDDDVLRDATIAGPFYAGGDRVTYTLVATASDTPVEITAP